MNLVLYGPAYANKTLTGEFLAEKLGYSFIDLNNEIQKECGACITEILNLVGPHSFRQLEHSILESVILKFNENTVLATGPSTLTHPYKDLSEKNSKMTEIYGIKVLLLPYENINLSLRVLEMQRKESKKEDCLKRMPLYLDKHNFKETKTALKNEWKDFLSQSKFKIFYGNLDPLETADLIHNTLKDLL